MIKRITAIALFFLVVGLMLYGGINTYDKLLGWERMWETPAIQPHEEPISSMEEGTVPFSGGEAVLRATPAEDLSPPFEQANATIISSGKTRYGYYCVQCHGKNHDGMGTVGQSFSPLPTDLRSRRVQAMSPGEMFRTISYGIPGGGKQPALHATIAPEYRWHITAYIKSLEVRNKE
ncbi:MAG: c-type cytochrome [Desulfohalobiaceae bacterium]